MRKRRREDEVKSVDSGAQETILPTTPKKPKKGDGLDKLLSLLSTEGSLVAGLTYLLTSIKNEKIDGQELTGQLLSRYLEKFPDCEHVLAPFGWSKEKRNVDVLLLCFEILEEVLLLAASGQVTESSGLTVPYRSIGAKLAHTLVANHLKIFYSSLVTSIPMRLVAMCLRVLVAMVMQGVESARELQQAFNFAYKPLEVFPNRTNTIQGRTDSVRSCFMNFALSFLVIGDADIIKTTLEMKGFLSSLFKLLPKDPSEIILLFLSTLDQKVVQDPSIPKKTKSLFFNTYVLKQISQILTTPTDHTHSNSADLQEYVYTFLLTLCTDFQLGICYKSKEPPQGLIKTTNPVILRLLLSLAGSLSHPLSQTLVLNTLTACTDLVIPFVSSLTMNFDPQPTSKWVASIEFVTKLYSLLPSLRTLLCAESVELPMSYLDVGVGLTVPMVVSRSSLGHGIQHPVLLVKFLTLNLMRVSLKRAVDMLGSVVPTRSLQTIKSFPVMYCDRVLKSLPDIKTLISLHQQLLSGGMANGQGPPTDKLDSSDQLRNCELQGSPDLLSFSVEVLRGYQTLCPSIFVQANYSLTKLLPFSPELGVAKDQVGRSVLVPTLQLLTEVPPACIKWTQKGGSALKDVLKLLCNPSSEVVKMAASLAHKLLVSMETFQGHEHELTLLLLSLREHYTPQVVEFVGRAVLEATKSDSRARMKLKQDSLSTEAADSNETTDKTLRPTLEDLLASPLVIPDALSCDSHVTCQEEDQFDRVFPLLSNFLSCTTNTTDELERFKDSFLRMFLLLHPHSAPQILPHRTSLLSTPVECSSCVGLLASCWGEGLVLSVSEEVEEQLVERWRSVGVMDEEFSCSVRVFTTTLWYLFANEVDNSGLINLLFKLLFKGIHKMSSTGNGEAHPVLSELVNSPFTKEAFLPDELFTKKHQFWVSWAILFSDQVGELLGSALRQFPDLVSSNGIQEARDKLLSAILEHQKNPTITIGNYTLLLSYLRVAIDSHAMFRFFEALFLSYKDIHEDKTSSTASLVSHLLASDTHVNEGVSYVSDVISSQEVGGVGISEQALDGLVKLAAKNKATETLSLVYWVVKHQLCQDGRSTKTVDNSLTNTPEVDHLSFSINSTVESLLSLRIDDCPSLPVSHPSTQRLPLSIPQLLTSPSDAFVAEKLDKIYGSLLASCAHNPRARRILDSSQFRPSPSDLPSSRGKALTVSDKMVKRILKLCVHHPSPVTAKITALLFKHFDFSLGYFEANLLSVLSDKLTVDEGSAMDTDGYADLEEERLCVLMVLLSYLEHCEERRGGEGDVGEGLKMAAKSLWPVCSGLITSSDSSATQNICSKILCIASLNLSKGQKKVEKLLLKWNMSSEDWSIPQLSLALSVPFHHSSLPSIALKHSLHTLGELFLTESQGEDEKWLIDKTTQYAKSCCQSSCESAPEDEVVEQFIYTTLKYRFTSPPALSLLAQLVRMLHCDSAERKEEEFNASLMYERVWSHSKFLPVMCQSHDQKDNDIPVNLKESLVELLVAMVDGQASLGDSSHVPLLLGAYSATRSKIDRGILYILFKYEGAGLSLSKHRPLLWGPAAIEHYRQRQEVRWLLWKQLGMQEVVNLLKRELINESIENFPIETDLNPKHPFSSGCGEEKQNIYDPCFLLPLLAQQLDPGNLIDCRRFIDSGCLGYLIASLSSTVARVRSMGGLCLELFVSHMDGSRFREKSQVSLLLEVLKNTLSEKDLRLLSIFSVFFSTATRLLLHAESPLYPVVTRYLVYKPVLDLREIPLLMTMLQSSSVEHTQERVWILQLLVNGLRCKEDYVLYRRKRVFDHCLSLLSTRIISKRCQSLILELVLRGVAIPDVAVDLVNNGLMTSLELVKTLIKTV